MTESARAALTDLGFLPVTRGDVDRVVLHTESVCWSPIRDMPVYLDPVANLVFDIIDGQATVGDLIDDVVDVVGVDRASASQQITRALRALQHGGVLESSDTVPDHHLQRLTYGESHDN